MLEHGRQRLGVILRARNIVLHLAGVLYPRVVLYALRILDLQHRGRQRLVLLQQKHLHVRSMAHGAQLLIPIALVLKYAPLV